MKNHTTFECYKFLIENAGLFSKIGNIEKQIMDGIMAGGVKS